MGLLDGLLGKKEAEVKVERIEFSQLPDWMAEQKERLGGPDERTAKVVEKLPEVLEKTEERLGELEEADMSREVEQRVQAIVSSSRDNYVSKVRKLLDGIYPGSGAIELSDKLGEVLEKVKKTDRKYGQRANFGFPGKLSKVKKELNGLVDASNRLNELLEEKKEKLKLLRAAEKELKKVEKAAGELEKLEERKEAAEKELKKAQAEKREDEEGVEEISHSERAEKLEAMEGELEGLKARKRELETFVLNVLGPLKRVFKKYARAVKEGKASGINVGKYADDPAGTYLWGEHTLPELLAKMQKAVQTGVLELGPGESEKALKKIRAISFSYLEKARSDYNRTTSRIRSIEVKMKDMGIGREVEKLKREIGSLEEKAESASKRIERLDKDMEEKQEEVKELKAALAGKLSEFIGGRCELA